MALNEKKRNDLLDYYGTRRCRMLPIEIQRNIWLEICELNKSVSYIPLTEPEREQRELNKAWFDKMHHRYFPEEKVVNFFSR